MNMYFNVLQKEISYFLELSEHLSVSKASESLGIQQAGLSKALKRLEDDLGQKLFQRKNNGLALTAAGEGFLIAVKNTQQTWDENIKKVIHGSEMPAGIFKIGFHPS